MHTIRKGTAADLPEIWALVQDAVADMNANGNHQWGEDYPSMSHFAEAIAAGELYAACGADGDILGVAVLNTEEEDCYADLSGWTAERPALVIHKVAVAPKAQRTGVASALFRYAFDLANTLGLRSVRMDTYCLNGRMQCLIYKYGFHYVGNIHFPDRPLAFRAYEKIL